MSTRLYGQSPATAAQATRDMSTAMGGLIIANTATVTGRFSRIQALTATVIATMTTVPPGLIQTQNDTDGVVTSVTLPAGSWIDGTITSFALTSGSVIAYHNTLSR